MAEPNGNAGAAPAPAPAAPPQPAPAAPTPVVDESDDKIIEDLRKEHFAKNPEKGKAEDGEELDIEVEVEEDDDGDDEPETEEKPEPAAKDKKGDASKPKVPKYKNASSAVHAITKALESGDPKKIAAAIGKPESFLKVNDAKWIAFREQTAALRERVRTVTQRETEFNTKLENARKEYGSVIAAQAAYKDGKYDQFVELVEQLTGDTYEEATRKVVKGETSLSPEVKALRKQMQEQAAEIARLKKAKDEPAEPTQEQPTQEQRMQRVVASVRQELADHAVTKLKGYERLVIDAVRNSWDADIEDYTMSFEEAADQIVEERRQEARHFTRGRQLPAPKTERSADTLPRGRASDPHTKVGEPWLERDLTEEELVNSVLKDYKAGRIRPV